MSTRIIDEAAKVLADPIAYTDEARLHAALTHLRADAPVSWVEAPGYRPFWAITRHADIMEIERANTLFTNSPRPVLMTSESDELQAAAGVRTLIHMDDPQHRVVRAIGADWFRPRAMRALSRVSTSWPHAMRTRCRRWAASATSSRRWLSTTRCT